MDWCLRPLFDRKHFDHITYLLARSFTLVVRSSHSLLGYEDGKSIVKNTATTK